MQPAVAGAGALRGLQAPSRARVAAGADPSSLAPPDREPFQLAVDLGIGIGSRDWLRGAATCFALCYAATSFWPDVSAVDAPVPAVFTDTELEALNALSVAPMDRGSATGRRMAPTDAVQALVNAPERPLVDMRVGLAAPGDLAGALTRAGVAQIEASQVAAMVGQTVPLAEIPAGTMLDLRLGKRPSISDSRPLERLSFRANFALRISVERVNGRLALTSSPIAVDATPLRIQGVIGTSLYRSARAAGVPPHIVEAYIRAIATQVGVPSGLSAGDRFDLIVEHRRAATGESETGSLLYAGLDRTHGRDIQLMPWSLGGGVQWLEASGVGKETSTGFRTPVQGRMTSPFGYRIHPILRYRRMHTGIDFGAAYGAPIVASANGIVASAGWDGGYGNAVRLSHGGGLLTLYGHMSRLAVSPGQQVAAGQVIGYIGSTGLSTGPHLHYELHRNGERIDPASFRHVERSQLAGAELEAFRARMRALLALPVGVAPANVRTASASPVPAPQPLMAQQGGW